MVLLLIGLFLDHSDPQNNNNNNNNNNNDNNNNNNNNNNVSKLWGYIMDLYHEKKKF